MGKTFLRNSSKIRQRFELEEGKIHSPKDILQNTVAAMGVPCLGEKGGNKNWALRHLPDRGSVEVEREEQRA